MNALPFSIICMFMILSQAVLFRNPIMWHLTFTFFLMSRMMTIKAWVIAKSHFILGKIELPVYLKDSKICQSPH